MWPRKKSQQKSYDETKEKPVILSSICTGEQSAGFQDIATGKFKEIMVIRNDRDFREFLSTYGLDEKQVGKIW